MGLETAAWKKNRVAGEGWLAVGDAVNLAARLLSQSATNEIVVSNTYFQTLPDPKGKGPKAVNLKAAE